MCFKICRSLKIGINILNIYCLTNLITNIYSYVHELHFFRILNSKSWINQIGVRSESVII